MVTDFLEEELFAPRGAQIIPSPDQRAGLLRTLQRIGTHFESSTGVPTEGTSPFGVPPSAGSTPEIQRPLCLSLDGWAGTGKTTLLRVVLRYLVWNRIPVQLLTPTGKAGDRLRTVLRMDPLYRTNAHYRSAVDGIDTIHHFLYGGPEEQAQCPECHGWYHDLVEPPDHADYRTCPNPLCVRDSDQACTQIPLQTPMPTRLRWIPPIAAAPGVRAVYLVDEGSMVVRTVHRHLLTALPSTSTLVYVWDKGQLPPVVTDEECREHGMDPKDPWGPTAPEVEPVWTLSTIHRQAAGSPIIGLATAIREGRLVEPPANVRPAVAYDARLSVTKFVGIETPVTWLVTRRRAGDDAILLCYTNRTRQTINALVREQLGLRALADTMGIAVVPGDVLLCRANTSIGMMNGTLFQVADACQRRFATYDRIDTKGKLVGREDVDLIELHAADQPLTWTLPQAIGATSLVFRDGKRNITRTARLVQDWYRRQYGEVPTQAAVADHLERYDAIAPDWVIPVDYGQAITVHASQGSQWDHVGVVWEGACWGMWRNDQPTALRWLYTAVTRAAKNLALFTLRKES